MNKIDPGPSFSENLVNSLGGGLEALTQNKLQQIQNQQRRTGIQQLLGVDAQQAKHLSGLPDTLLNSELNRRSQSQNILLKQNLKSQREQELSNLLYNQQQSQTQQRQLPPEQMNNLQAANAIGQNFGLPQAPIQQQNQQVPTAPMARQVPPNLPPQLWNQFTAHQEKQQAAANATNKKFLDTLGESAPGAERMYELLNELDTLDQTGKVATGFKGKYVPLWAQNPETQRYAAIANELATLVSDNARGRPSAFRLKVVQASKPNIEQDLLTRGGIKESIRKQVQRILDKRDIVDDILKENGGYQPANINALVDQRYKDIEKQQNHEVPQQVSTVQANNAETQNQESPLGTLGRGLVRTGSRIGEALATNVGDIASTGLGLGNYLTGGAIPTYESIQENLPISPPTSAQAQAFSEKLTGGYTAPQSATEEFIDNIASTATKLIGGGGLPHLTKALSTIISPQNAARVAKLVLPFSGIGWKSALGLSTAGEVGAKGAELLGAGPVGQQATKLGFMIAAGIPSIKQNIASTMENSYKQADAAAAGKQVNVSQTTKQLKGLYKDVVNGASPNKDIVKSIIGDTVESLERGATPASNRPFGPPNQTTLDKLIRLKKDINEWYTKAERPQVKGEKHLPIGSRKYIGDLNRIISEPINEYAQNHPEFGKPYALAEDLYRGTKDVDFLNKWMDNHLSSSLSLKTFLPKALAVGGLATGASHIAELSNLFIKHPATRIHYLGALKAASKGNVDLFKKHEREFDKELKK